MGVELAYGTATPRSVKTAGQTLLAPVELTQYKTPPVEMTPVPTMPEPSVIGGPPSIGVALEATTVARLFGTPGDEFVCVTDRRRS